VLGKGGNQAIDLKVLLRMPQHGGEWWVPPYPKARKEKDKSEMLNIRVGKKKLQPKHREEKPGCSL